VPKFSINFEEIHSRAHGNFEDQDKFSKSSTFINYCIIVNAYDNYTVRSVSRCALTLRYVDLVVCIEAAVEACLMN
jgi:hypothetical protein